MDKFKFSFGMIYDIIPTVLLVISLSTNPVLIIASICLIISRLLIELKVASNVVLGLTVIYAILGFIGAFSLGSFMLLEKIITVLILTKTVILISKFSEELF